MSQIVPLILCGGTGSRLWPVSRTESPKQFHAVSGWNTLSFLQATVQRHTGVGMRDPILVTHAKHAHHVRAQLGEIQVRGEIIAEPVARNTGPAVLAAALRARQADRDAVLLVLPSDHVVEGDINRQLVERYGAAQDGRIITFGLQPHYPETGYGYITDGGPIEGLVGLHHVAEFVEKPPLERARALLNGGNAYWASGISMFRAETIIEEYRRFDPEAYLAVCHAVANETRTEQGVLLDERAFSKAASQPTEVAVFEKTDAIALAPLDISWNDVGSWEAMHAISKADGEGNVLSGDVVSIGTRNSLVRSNDRLVAVVGLEDVIVVDTHDALLVASRSKSQQVKNAVQELVLHNRQEAHAHLTRKFHWGQSHRAFATDACDVTHLTVNPGSHLSVDGKGGPTHLIGVRGDFQVTGGPEGHQDLLAGARLSLMQGQDYRVQNIGDVKGEIVLVSNTDLVPPPVAPRLAGPNDDTRDELRA